MHTVSRSAPHEHAEPAPSDVVPIVLSINGMRHALLVEPWTSLLDLLRERSKG
ncbi:hypothetical protein [Paraburkholderia acidipaludis]|uniref:hypothetical protein n=1 Tax=Paraburkholderia acidipaludis TaxID=660537 RepID=UPI000A62E013|nr:hypothetical protein [Paraburkholderia acidipaludis]